MKIIILHGWGHNKEIWNDFSKRFNEKEIVAIDLPGFGEEPLISDDWGIPEYADWVKRKITQMNLNESVILLGHSFGGRIAGLIASKNPSWLKALILYGSPNIYRPSFKTRLIIKRNKILRKLGLKKIINLLSSTNSEIADADKKNLGKVFRKVVPFDETNILLNIKVKTFLLWGSNDNEAPVRLAEEIHTLIPNSELVVLENLGHNIHLENPNLFYGTVKKFIESI